MKLKQRAWLSLVGVMLIIAIFSLHMILFPAWVHYNGPEVFGKSGLDFRNLDRSDRLISGRNLNMMASNMEASKNLSHLLSVIAQSVKERNLNNNNKRNLNEDSEQLLDVVSHDQNLSDALIRIGNILDIRREKHRTLTKEILPQFAPDPGGFHGVNVGDNTGDDTVVQPQSNDDGNSIRLETKEVNNIRDVLKKVKRSQQRRTRNEHKPLNAYKNIRITQDTPSFRKFQRHINRFELYSSDGAIVDQLLSDITSLPLINMAPKSGGTQLKLTFFFSDKSQAIFKPMRFPREQETLPDHFYFSDYERHNAEIAAFHLDRILDLRRVPPVAGRVVNVTQDIWRYADGKFEKTFFISPAGNVCFHGHCDYYCDTGHAICGHPELLEGSFVTYLPIPEVAPRSRWRHPWRRSYHKRRKAVWETDYKYCDEVRVTPPYDRGRRLLDLMDMAVFDFLTGNMDRHHYETFTEFDNETIPILFDNGRSFGKASHDEMSILAPVYQCCLLRASTLRTLFSLYSGPTQLSQAIRKSLSRDSISPILTEGHLVALDRRVALILLVVSECLASGENYENIVIDDGL